jgi:hypothetical protein
VDLNTVGRLAELLLASATTAYITYLLLAIFTQRHLFGDGAWFLVKMLNENRIAIWNVAGLRDIFVGRFGAFAYQEYPTLLASRLGVHNLRELSAIYGLTLFAFKPLGVLLCYHFARDKRHILFPILSVFAGTINSEAYIVAETHLLSALFWAALFGMLYCRQLKNWDLAAMVVVSAPLLVCYESMAVYGLILCVATWYRLVAVSNSKRDKLLTVAFGLWYALGAVFGWLAVIFPRSASQRGAFLDSLLFVFRNDHIGARISCVVLLLCVLIVVVPERYKRALNSIVVISAVSSMVIPLYIFRHPGRTSFDSHILARTMNVTLPLGLVVVFLAVYLGSIQLNAGKYRRLFIMVAALGICQSWWHVLATAQWTQMVTVLQSELRNNTGAVRFEGSLMSRWDVDGNPIRNLHADWPLLPMSVLFADHGRVNAVLLPPVGGFEPFNPFSERTLPDLRRYGVAFEPYLSALQKQTSPYEPGTWVSLDAKTDRTGVRQIGQWWDPEPWGTWIGRDAGVIFDLSKAPKSDMVLEAVAGAFVNEQNPHVDVEVRVNDVAVGKMNFNYNKSAPLYQTYDIRVPEQVLEKPTPTIVWFHVTGARAPSALGISGDPRVLGLGVVRVRLTPSN